MGIKKGFKDIVIVDDTGRIEYCSITSPDFFDLTPKLLVGTKAHQHYKNLNNDSSTLIRAIRYGETSLNTEQELATKGNKRVRQFSDTYCIKDKEKVIGAVEFAYYDEKNDIIKEYTSTKKTTVKERENGPGLEDIIGESPEMKILRNKLKKIINLDSPVLITGETGTGKELTARVLHNSGSRRNKNFIYLNCGAIPEHLFESMLFGVKSGIFTDAKEQDGLFNAADKGTIFLDEIQEMPREVQGKLLRVLEEKRIRPVGGEEEINVDVRIIASCNMDINALINSGVMRSDLYFRLAVIQLELPPLRQRKEDIRNLTSYYLNKFSHELDRHDIYGISENLIALFESYNWPGNIRELKNALESTFYVCEGNELTFDNIISRHNVSHSPENLSTLIKNDFLAGDKNLKEYLDEFRKLIILDELKKHHNDPKATAKALGLSLQMMKYDMEKYNIHL